MSPLQTTTSRCGSLPLKGGRVMEGLPTLHMNSWRKTPCWKIPGEMKSLPSAPGKPPGSIRSLTRHATQGQDQLKTRGEDPEIPAVPIPAEHKVLLDSLQDAVHDALWLIESNTGAKLSGPALDQFKTQAEALSKSLKTLSIGAPIQSTPELHPYFKFTSSIRPKLASLVGQLTNAMCTIKLRHRSNTSEATNRQAPARDQTSSHIGCPRK
jgi:hypothetical protein